MGLKLSCFHPGCSQNILKASRMSTIAKTPEFFLVFLVGCYSFSILYLKLITSNKALVNLIQRQTLFREFTKKIVTWLYVLAKSIYCGKFKNNLHLIIL